MSGLLPLILALAGCTALGAAGALVVLGAGRLGRSSGDDIEALADATREPRITSQDIYPVPDEWIEELP